MAMFRVVRPVVSTPTNRAPSLPAGVVAFRVIEDRGETMLVEYDDPATGAALLLAARISVVGIVKGDALTNDDVAAVAPLFPDWQPGITVAAGEVYRWDGTLVECLQPHTTQSDWTPDVAASLWKIHRSAGLVNVWVQPDSTNGYMIGERVLYPDANGATYESLINDNVWSPGAYPAGWSTI